MPIDAEKSSLHDFNILVQLADGREFNSRPINLLYYRPRWFADYNKQDLQPDDAPFDNHDLVGTDVRQIKNADRWSCERACESEPRCRAYTVDKWNQWCFLKSAVKLMRFDPKNTSGLKKGTQRPRTAGEPTIVERYRNKAFPGYGYMIQQQIDFDICERNCEADESCVAYMFRKTTRDCYLFDDAGEYSSNPDTDSGVKRQPAR